MDSRDEIKYFDTILIVRNNDYWIGVWDEFNSKTFYNEELYKSVSLILKNRRTLITVYDFVTMENTKNTDVIFKVETYNYPIIIKNIKIVLIEKDVKKITTRRMFKT